MTAAHDELENLPTNPGALRALVLSMKFERDALAAERDQLLRAVGRQQHLIRGPQSSAVRAKVRAFA